MEHYKSAHKKGGGMYSLGAIRENVYAGTSFATDTLYQVSKSKKRSHVMKPRNGTFTWKRVEIDNTSHKKTFNWYRLFIAILILAGVIILGGTL